MARKQLGAKATQPADAATIADIQSPPFRGCVRNLAGDFNMVNGQITTMTFDNTVYDEGGFTQGISGDTIVKIPPGMGGFYSVNTRFIVDNANNDGGIAILIRMNGFLYLELPMAIKAAVGAHMATTADIFQLSPGDSFNATYYANAPGMVMRSQNARYTQFTIEKIG